MAIFKKSIIIFILTAAMVGFSGCAFTLQNNQTTESQGKGQTENQNDQNQNNQSQQNQQELKEAEDWQGEVIDEGGGLKKYINKYFGIEFKYTDTKDNPVVFWGDKSGIYFGYKETSEEAYSFMYINYYNSNQYNNFKNFVENNWNVFNDIADMASLKDLKNKNNINYYQVIAKISRPKYWSATNTEMISYNSRRYFVELRKIDDNIRYMNIVLNNPELEKQVIDSFRIIEN
jgi:hypothetical protein